jgi:hypothetical protein
VKLSTRLFPLREMLGLPPNRPVKANADGSKPLTPPANVAMVKVCGCGGPAEAMLMMKRFEPLRAVRSSTPAPLRRSPLPLANSKS